MNEWCVLLFATESMFCVDCLCSIEEERKIKLEEWVVNIKDWVVIWMRETLVNLWRRMIINLLLLHGVIIGKDVNCIYSSRHGKVKGNATEC